MFYLLLSICLSVILLINFRVFPRFQVNTAQAIGLNYIVCFLVGLLLIPEGQHLTFDLKENWTWYCLALGVGFIVTFILSGLSTQKAGMTATSLANNLSLVIPVLASLLLYNTNAKEFSSWNYLGLGFAFLAVGMATYKGDKSQKSVSSIWLPLAVFALYGITNSAINYINLQFIPDPNLVIPVTLVMVSGAMISGIILVIYRYFRFKETLAVKNILGAVSLGIPNFLSFYFLILTLTYYGNSGAFVYPIYNMGVILVSALVGIFFFKESLSKLNIAGLVLGLVAIILISYQELGIG
ncbi:EamA/RhaT family transporter [Jiulongibacter sp. NS-SX5]|uniref:EamA/RhaT family transporter n=1 Tax=Jiulongibacter sp. NS-SX5 TaxID=3463854 RepID=UPI004058E302